MKIFVYVATVICLPAFFFGVGLGFVTRVFINGWREGLSTNWGE